MALGTVSNAFTSLNPPSSLQGGNCGCPTLHRRELGHREVTALLQVTRPSWHSWITRPCPPPRPSLHFGGLLSMRPYSCFLSQFKGSVLQEAFPSLHLSFLRDCSTFLTCVYVLCSLLDFKSHEESFVSFSRTMLQTG